MEIKDLQPRQGKVELVAKVIDKEEPRAFEKFGRTGKVCNAKIEDSTGQVKLTLWNEQCDEVSKGDTVKIENGYCGEWQGEMQLSTGKFGKLTIVDKAPEEEQQPAAEEKTEEPKEEAKEELDEVDVEEEKVE